MTYRGWSNLETWRVNARVHTDEQIHVARMAMLDSLAGTVTARDERRFYLETIQDRASRSAGIDEEAAAIDFEQLAAEWEHIRSFRRGLLGT